MHGVDYNDSSPRLVSFSVRTPVKMVALTSGLALPLSVAQAAIICLSSQRRQIFMIVKGIGQIHHDYRKNQPSVVRLWRVAFSHYVWKAAAWLLRPKSHRQLLPGV